MDYKKRIADDLLALKMESFGAALIVGPKGCGKTTTAKQKAKQPKRTAPQKIPGAALKCISYQLPSSV